MDAFKKSWKTSLVGLVVIGYYGYKAFYLKEPINPEEMVGVLIGAGFLISKDGDKSHTK